MNEQELFDQLWADYLEGELDEARFAELRELMANDDGRLSAAVNDFQLHRLLGLHAQDSDTRHETFVRETMSKLPQPRDAFVGKVMGKMPRPQRSAVIPWIPNWALSAAATFAIMAAIWFFTHQRPTTIAKITDLSGPALWTGDAGRVIGNLQAGTTLSGGTVEGTSPSSWVELTFNDGSIVTLSGDSMLTFSDLGQKELHLRRGGLSADVKPQSEPMLIYTRSARLIVRGTRFDVQTEMASTSLNVHKGLVEIRRISDGQSVTVPASYRAVAAADQVLTPVLTPAAVHSWESDMGRGSKEGLYGKWRPESNGAGGLLGTIPYVTPKGRIIFSCSMSVSRAQTPVILNTNSQIKVRGMLKKSSSVWVGLTLRKPSGEFAGRFRVIKQVGERFDLTVPLAEFELDHSLKHAQAELATEPDGLIIDAIYAHTLHDQAGLEVSHFAISESTLP